MKSRIVIFCVLCLTLQSFSLVKEVYILESGKIFFRSDAPLEIIEASSNEVKGIIDIRARTYAFTIDMMSFEGFNSPLQRTHFNENYLESNRFKTASFLGKIIEKVDLKQDGEYTLRAKGQLKIHGVTQERIIKSKATVKNGVLNIHSHFTVLLREHNISIPKIVNQKIAEEIYIDVAATFKRSIR